MSKTKVKGDLTIEEAKKQLKKDKPEELAKLRKKLAAKKPKKKISHAKKRPPSRWTRLKIPIWKECEICGNDFETHYEIVKLCSPECIAEYNSLHSGRPKADLQAIKEALKPFLQIGCDLKEAALEAWVCSYDTVLKYKKINEKFNQWLEAMQNFSLIKSKRVIYKAISNNDVASAKWWLERKKPSEFAPYNKTDLTTGGNPIGFTMDLPPSQFWEDDDDDE